MSTYIPQLMKRCKSYLNLDALKPLLCLFCWKKISHELCDVTYFSSLLVCRVLLSGRQFLGVGQVVHSDSQKYVQECVWYWLKKLKMDSSVSSEIALLIKALSEASKLLRYFYQVGSVNHYGNYALTLLRIFCDHEDSPATQPYAY